MALLIAAQAPQIGLTARGWGFTYGGSIGIRSPESFGQRARTQP